MSANGEIGGSVSGPVKTAFARVDQPLNPNDNQDVTSEGVRIENGLGDRTIHEVHMVPKLTNEQDFADTDVLQVGFDGGVYFGSNDPKPGADEYVDESNYIARFNNEVFLRNSYDNTNTTSSRFNAIHLDTQVYLQDPNVTKEWREGVTLSFTLSSVRYFANITDVDDVFVNVDFLVFYTESGEGDTLSL